MEQGIIFTQMGYIFDKKLMPEICSQLHKNYKKVILTHGTFDLYHVGHSVFLNKSKKEGDILMVGVESDERVKKVKGINRPVIPALQRAEILSHLDFVDFVFLIDEKGNLNEKYYIDLYKKVSPDIVTYGRNFQYEDQFKRNKNLINGVAYKQIDSGILPLNYIESTTNIIKRIKNN